MLGQTPVFRPKSCVYTKSNRSLVTVISGNLNKVYVAYQYCRQSFFVPSTQLLPKNHQNIKQAKQNICHDMTFEPCEIARTHCIRCCVLSNKKTYNGLDIVSRTDITQQLSVIATFNHAVQLTVQMKWGADTMNNTYIHLLFLCGNT